MTTKQYNDIVDEHADGLLRFVVYTVRSSSDGRDIVQEAFLRLWQRRKEVKHQTAKNYLFTIAYNLSISHHRKKRPEEDITNHTTLSHDIHYDNSNEIIWREIERLPVEEKTIIMLRDWEGYSYAEIEQITELSAASVKIKLHRVRQKLRQKLEHLRKDD